MNIKKGDNVILIAGKDKGKKGKVTKVIRTENRVVVEGLNLMKRRLRPRKSNEKGQVVEVANPLNVSNVLLWCDKCGKGVRVRQMVDKKGKKNRVCAKCQKTI